MNLLELTEELDQTPALRRKESTEGLLTNPRTAARRAYCGAVNVLKLTVELDGTRALRYKSSLQG